MASPIKDVGPWSEIKLEIIKEYASAYSRVLSAQDRPKFHHAYIDAFSGSGLHLSRKNGDYILGSPLNSLLVEPPFKEYHFIDLDKEKTDLLKELTKDIENAYVHSGDCNDLLLEKVFPGIKYGDFKRALCLLDPYGLHLDWNVIQKASEMKTIEIFLNFPTADMNRNVFWKNPENVDEEQIRRMNLFWGDDSWKNVVYTREMSLFDFEEKVADNEIIAKAFQRRLQEVAGFNFVSKPLPMRNSRNAIVYYLFFASHRPVAEKIVADIFNKYR